MVTNDGAATVRARFERMFPGQSIALVDNVDRMAARFDTLPDQRPATCGAFALSYLLEPLGYATHDGHDLRAEDYLAHLASVIIEDFEIEPSAAIAAQVASGGLTEAEALERHRAAWYRYPVRHDTDPVVVGTSAAGIARAVALGTEGGLASLPLPARDRDGSVLFTPDRWHQLLELLAGSTESWRWHAILNFQVEHILKPDHPAFTVENLRLPDPAAIIPLDDWDVGHFVGVAGIADVDGQPWLLLFDTYKHRGFEGYQPQPAELIRRGLVRTDGRGGGILLVLPREHVAAAAEAVRRIGVEPDMWDNGSTDPEDWAWSLGR